MRKQKKLTSCTTVDEQMEWVKAALLHGKTLTDLSLWLGGVDRPDRLIARLRRQGVSIKTTRKTLVDAAGEAYVDLAWRAANPATQ